MHDGMYSFELGVVSFDIILERSGFGLFFEDPRRWVCGGRNLELALLGH